ncbi:SGNH/GDSL hydrolase family protein [Bacillus sp. CECT 9360]|uniref:SGNH/GDSL hydrolase family protein n=1 Tax=Bacillus sp. CECT 9360 TaxID=2845821 RepID=UPI001E4A40BA|nr:SGNH/GDSL hydrolase family protein [Bacillus sp. CECT 9360]CAH0346451.1 hypothetical protein BCI9360_02787 [Bacillus sp. CECT 9360]
MKKFIVILLGIACAITLVFGNVHWKEQIESSVNSSSAAKRNAEDRTEEEKLLSYASNWPKESKRLYEKKLQEKKPFTILFAGSKAMAANENGWPVEVKEQLADVYGDTVTVKVKQFDLNSMEFVQQNKQQVLIKEKADMIILEPFTLADNGEVNIKDSFDNIRRIIQDVKESKNDTTFILQPPHPLYQATYYPQQVEDLKNFAKENKLAYLDHWTAWPDPNSEEMLSLLAEDRESVNANGHELWAEAIEEFLIEGSAKQ